MEAIVARSLTRHFDDRVAVEHLDLEIAEGEIFGLLGPNGAGKTTTVRMLTCLIAPSEGEGFVGGHDIRQDAQAIRRMVGLLTETPGLYEKLDAWSNLAFYAQLYEVENVDAQVERYLRAMGLWGRHSEPVAQFSKGMKQRLAIARALVHEPKVLFLDEPTAGLDPQAAKGVRDAIEALRSEGRTILLCTHNLPEAEQLCDRVAVLRTRLLAVDKPTNLRRRVFGRQTAVRLREIKPDMVSGLHDLGFVRAIAQEGNQLFLSIDDPDAENPAIVKKLVELGGEIQEVTEQAHSLEETYLSLVEGIQ